MTESLMAKNELSISRTDNGQTDGVSLYSSSSMSKMSAVVEGKIDANRRKMKSSHFMFLFRDANS